MGEWRESVRRAIVRIWRCRSGASGPGVLVLHAWWGLTPVFTAVCDGLAAAGYVALAPSLYRRRGDGRDHRRGRGLA